jgi:hypothetical protein
MAKASTVVTVLCRWCQPYRAKLRQWKYGLEDGGGLPLELLTFYAKNAFVEFTHLFILIGTSYLTWQDSQHRTRSRTTLETRLEHFKAAWTLFNVPRVLIFGKSQMDINLEKSKLGLNLGSPAKVLTLMTLDLSTSNAKTSNKLT